VLPSLMVKQDVEQGSLIFRDIEQPTLTTVHSVVARACHQLADLGRWAPAAHRIGPVSPDCHTQASIGAA
jgi:hypothetical protein